MNYSIWVAVSTASQAEDDKESLHEQEIKSRAVAQSKGWQEVSIYSVPGESRTRYVNLRDAEENIPALRAMLEDAKARRFDVLVMYDYSRLRDLLDPVAKTLANYGVQLYSVNQPTEPLPPEAFDPYASDSSSMMMGMSQIISRWQISDLRRKYRFGVKARVDRGLPALKIPYGYMRPPGREGDKTAVPVQHPAHCAAVLEIKNKFLSGMSIYSLRDYLTERYPTPTGIPVWSTQTIRKILRNPFYAGKVSFGQRLTINDPRHNRKKLVHNKTPYMRDGAHAPLWSWADHLAIMAEFDRRHALPTTAKYPWSGILFCAECDHRLRRKEKRYSCLHCGDVVIHDEDLQARLPSSLQSALREIRIDPADSSPVPAPVDVSAALGALDKQRKRIQQAYESEVYTLAEAEAKMKEIDDKIKNLRSGDGRQAKDRAERELFRVTYEQAQVILDDFPEWMMDDEPKEVNALLVRLFRKVKVSKVGDFKAEFRN